MKRPRLTIAISTLGARISFITLPQPHQDICYLILVQSPLDCCELARFIARPDVKLEYLKSLGLSHSRNAALDLTDTDYLMFSDDDIGLNLSGICRLISHLERDPQVLLARGWRQEQWRVGQIAAPEMMLRVHPIKAMGIRFDTQFGLGAEYPMGEEFVFFCDLRRQGGEIVAYPEITGTHPHPCTGRNWSDPKLDIARKAILRRCFPRTHRFLRVLYAAKFITKFKSFRRLLAFVLQ